MAFLRRLTAYSAFALTIIFALWYDINYGNEDQTAWTYNGYAGKLKYLTFITAWVQAIYWCLVVIAGFSTLSYEYRRRTTRLHKIVDFYHASLAFPAGSFVCITFWLIYAVDRELVYPKRLDKVIPQWLNHVMHTAHIFFLLIDKYLTRHRYPSQLLGMASLIVFAGLYNVWILYLALEKDIWVYPILAIMDWPYRIAFFLVLWAFFLLLYKTGALVTVRLWGIKAEGEMKKRS